MSDVFDPYKTLQVDPEADPDVIQAAYRRLASRFHPDRGGGTEAAERMVALNRAWEILSDADRRRAFDVERSATAPPAGGSIAEDRRRWGGARESASAETGPVVDEPIPTFTSGRSSVGGGYDAATMRSPDGTAAAGPAPGNPSGPVLNFGRYAGWSLGEIGRRDIEYLEWLDRTPIGRPYRDAIDGLLRRAGRRRTPQADAGDRRGLFRRR
jgi:curved DNA-binding protein CbpA